MGKDLMIKKDLGALNLFVPFIYHKLFSGYIADSCHFTN